MGRGATGQSPAAILYGNLTRRPKARNALKKAEEPAGALPDLSKRFRPTLRRLGLKEYVDGRQDGDLSGWCGGKAWLAQGELPASWIFKSASPCQSDLQWDMTRLIDECRTLGDDATPCELDPTWLLDSSGEAAYRICFAGEESNHIVKADWIEAARQILKAQKRDVVDLRLAGMRLLGFDESEELVAIWSIRRDYLA